MRGNVGRTVVGAAAVGTVSAAVARRFRRRREVVDGGGPTRSVDRPLGRDDGQRGGGGRMGVRGVVDGGSKGRLLDAPVAPVPPLLDASMVGDAVGQLGGIVSDAMERTGVPGGAVAVVYHDEVLFAEGFGVRRVGGSERVDADTVFQVASVSKPVTSAIVAGVVGKDKATWTDPVITWEPGFALRDPYVTANATLA